jgi:hypothetical protein
MRNFLQRRFLFFFLLLFSGQLMATPDCPIITGRFAGLADGTTVDNSSTGWYLDASGVASTGSFAIRSNRIRARELGGVGIWYSKAFSTAGYTDFQVAVKIHSEGDMNSSEYVRIYYKINGGAEVLYDQRTGNFGTIDFISPVLNGSNVQLVVKMYNYNNGGSQPSQYYVEEYRVFKEHGTCTGSGITVSASAGNGGVLTCANGSTTLTATSSASGTTYSWTGPNSFTSTSASPSVSAAGTYTVVGTSSSGSGSASVTVTENKTPPTLTATGGALACGTSVTLQASSNASGATYSWSGPSFSSNAQNPVVSTAGNYTVTVTNPANGCTASQTVSVTAGSGASVFWEELFTQANGTISRSGSPGWSLQNVAAGTFSVQNNELMAAFSAGNEGIWLSDEFSIANKSSISLSIKLKSATSSTNDYFEEDDYISVFYKLNGGSQVKIFEDFYGLNNTTNTKDSITFTAAIPNGSTLQIIVKLRNSNTTERYYIDDVKLSGLNASTAPTVSTSVTGTATCTATAQLFATASTSATAYSWTGPNGFTSSSQNPLVSAGGQYTVTATLAGGCTVSAVQTVPENRQTPDLTATGGSLGCFASIVLNANSSISNATYSWSGPGGFSSTAKNPTVSAAGTYTVTVTNPANGCTDVESVQVAAPTGTTITVYGQNFTAGNGTTSASGSSSWSVQSSPSGSIFSVQGNQFQVSNTGSTSEGVWASGIIDISGKTNITLSAGVRSTFTGSSGDMNASGTLADYIRFYYKLNNGSEVLFHEKLGSINNHSATLTAINATAPAGNTLQIIVRARTTANDEFYHFDNVTITGFTPNTLTATASASGELTCAGSTVPLTGSSSAAGATYSWTGPGGFTAATQNATAGTAGVYTLTVTDPSTGCTATDTANVLQSAGTTSSAWSEDFTLGNGTTSVSGSWSVTGSPSGAVASVNSSQFRFSNTGTTGESVWSTAPITISGKTGITFTAGVRSSITGSAVMNESGEYGDYLRFYYKLNGTGSEVLFSQSLGAINSHSTTLTAISGSIPAGNTVQIIVRARATGADEFYHFDNAQVTATTPPVGNINASAAANGIITCINPSATLSGSSTAAGVSYSWTGPNGFTSSSQNPTVGAGGIYTLTVTSGGCSSTDTALVVADTSKPAAVQITASGTGQINCTTSHVSLLATPNGPGLTHQWAHPDGLIIPAYGTTAYATGIHTYTVTKTSNGCSSIGYYNVVENKVYPNVTSINPNSPVLTCTNSSVTLTGTSSTPNVTYSWIHPNGSEVASSVITADVEGNYHFKVTDNTNGCVTFSGAFVPENKFVPANVAITAPANASQITCTNSQVVLTGSSSTSGVTYSWTGPNGALGNSTSVNAGTPGNYTLVATNTVNGCSTAVSSQVVQNITAPTNVTASTTGGATQLTCSLTSITINGSGTATGGATYSWTSTNGFTATTPSIAPINPGTYTLKVTDAANGCFTNAAAVTLTQNIILPDGVTATRQNDLNCTNPTTPITGTSNVAGSQFSWTGPNGFTANTASFVAENGGTYNLKVTNPANGCYSTASIMVAEDKVKPAPVTATNNGPLPCTGGSVTITGTYPAGMDFFWQGPNDFFGFSESETISDPGVYEFVVTNFANGCSNSAFTTVSRNCTNAVTQGAVAVQLPDEKQTARAVKFEYKAYPNPAASQAFVEFRSPENAHVTVSVYNSIGARQKVLFNGNATANQPYKLPFPVNTLSAGSYYYIINVNGKRYSGNMIVVK